VEKKCGKERKKKAPREGGNLSQVKTDLAANGLLRAIELSRVSERAEGDARRLYELVKMLDFVGFFPRGRPPAAALCVPCKVYPTMEGIQFGLRNFSSIFEKNW